MRTLAIIGPFHFVRVSRRQTQSTSRASRSAIVLMVGAVPMLLLLILLLFSPPASPITCPTKTNSSPENERQPEAGGADRKQWPPAAIELACRASSPPDLTGRRTRAGSYRDQRPCQWHWQLIRIASTRSDRHLLQYICLFT